MSDYDKAYIENWYRQRGNYRTPMRKPPWFEFLMPWEFPKRGKLIRRRKWKRFVRRHRRIYQLECKLGFCDVNHGWNLPKWIK